MAGLVKKYGFINAKLRARISKVLDQDKIQQMIRAFSVAEAVQVLNDTPFEALARIYDQTGDLKLGELELFKQELDLYVEIERYVTEELRDFVQALALRYEVENLKNALRLWFDQSIRGRDISVSVGYVYRGKVIYNINYDALVNAGDWESIVEELKGTPYLALIKSEGEKIAEKKTLFSVEIALDKYYYEHLREQAEKLLPRDAEIAKRLIGVEIDLQNINWIIRFKNFYKMELEEILTYLIPAGYNLKDDLIRETYRSQNVAGLLRPLLDKKYSGLSMMLTGQESDSYSRLVLVERILDHIMMHEVSRSLAGYPFTIGIILSYFIIKRKEIQKVIMILNAKQYNLSEERIMGVL